MQVDRIQWMSGVFINHYLLKPALPAALLADHEWRVQVFPSSSAGRCTLSVGWGTGNDLRLWIFYNVNEINHYASWLEDGREALGKAYGIHYLDFYNHGIVIPIKLFQLSFQKLLYYGKTYQIVMELLWSESALLEFSYSILDQNGTCTTTGSTTQLMLTTDGTLCLELPPFYRDFCQRWRQGLLEPIFCGRSDG